MLRCSKNLGHYLKISLNHSLLVLAKEPAAFPALPVTLLATLLPSVFPPLWLPPLEPEPIVVLILGPETLGLRNLNRHRCRPNSR